MTTGQKFVKFLTTYAPLVLLVIQIIYLGALLSAVTPDYARITNVLITMGIALIWFFIGERIDHDLTHFRFQREVENIKRVLSHIGSIEILRTHDEFYTKLQNARRVARRQIQSTQLDPGPPSTYGRTQARQSYFSSDVAVYKAHPSVNFYRIISIETKEKLQWVKDLISQTKDFPNVFIAYVKIDSISQSVPFPKMLSLQIIDETEVFVLHPAYSYMPADYKPCYYLKDAQVAQIYVNYYEKVWERICQNNEHGLILKDGIISYEDRLTSLAHEKGWQVENGYSPIPE